MSILICFICGFYSNGGGAGTRTPDAADMNRLLYQLSYTAFVTSAIPPKYLVIKI